MVALDGGYHERPLWIFLGFVAMAAHGAVVAGVFWLITLRKNGNSPDFQPEEATL